jgi:hypothetical protein
MQFTYGGEQVPLEVLPKLMSPLGAGRVDPFQSYPRSVFASEHKLLDFCKDRAFFAS